MDWFTHRIADDVPVQMSMGVVETTAEIEELTAIHAQNFLIRPWIGRQEMGLCLAILDPLQLLKTTKSGNCLFPYPESS